MIKMKCSFCKKMKSENKFVFLQDRNRRTKQCMACDIHIKGFKEKISDNFENCICFNCKKEFIKPPSKHLRGVYCSKECHREYIGSADSKIASLGLIDLSEPTNYQKEFDYERR